ncbi:prephenate dehydrogenase/arogenate dehydrogenase family protein, partial [Patescibacteria group bacterium]|nr:prephenate dehydrogenase/arogenate dehydrogenase family protein [Patescibacteria group bacterium]
MEKPVIGIIGGKGKMGKYFTEFFERNGYSVIISDKQTKLTNRQVAKKADVVIISVPIDKTEEVIREVAPHIKKSGLLMDLTSFKVFPMEAMKKTKASYLGCHPLFGPTAPIEGQLAILCPGKGKKWFNWLKDLLAKNKVIVRELPAKKHDEFMAYIQALTHFSDIALVDALRKSKIPIQKFISYESPVYRLELDMIGRILNQDPNLYANIQIQNPSSSKVIKSFIKSCEELAKTIDQKNIKGNTDIFKKCAKYLDGFCKTAMEESDKLLSYLNLIPELPTTSDKPKGDIAVLGPKNTYSDMALKNYRPKIKPDYVSSIAEVFELIKKGKVKEGLVPIENSLTGSVRETLDELYHNNIWIEKVISQPIHLALV